MTIDVTRTEELKLNLTQAAGYFASSRVGKATHKSRVLRYIKDGARAASGKRVYLVAVRQGSQWVTTPAAIQAFCDELTPRSTDRGPETSCAERRLSVARAARALDAAGIS